MKRGIEVTAIFWDQPNPSEVVVSFSLAYLDWCKLQDSETWHRLERLLEGAQRDCNSARDALNDFEAEEWGVKQ